MSTRDAQALGRDGEPFFRYNKLASESGVVLEILFGDGIWMLAMPDDLTWARHEGAQ